MDIPLLGIKIDELTKLVIDVGGQPKHALALANSIYKKNIKGISAIESIPIHLNRTIDNLYSLGKYPPIKVFESQDGSRKYLFQNHLGQLFESVYMPSKKRNTLCLSTQSGCRMGCGFCLTGKIGFNGNLSAQDILNQYYSIEEYETVNRIVIMGMGEPFDNFIEVKKAVEILTANWGGAFGASNITLSTVGLIEPLQEFLKKPFCNLAISLSNPIAKERAKIMPIEKSNPIEEVVKLIRMYPMKKPLRISFEYVALKEVNLSIDQAIEIARLLSGIKCHLNIIPWNEHQKSNYKSPTKIELNQFIDCLNSHGILTSIRQSRGQDIGAACGQMAGSERNNKIENK